jgi:hypothetical protein
MLSPLATQLIETLTAGGQLDRETLLFVEEFLRKGWSPGFTSFFEEIETAGITSEDAGAVRGALYEAFRRGTDPIQRREFLFTLSRFGGSELREALVQELHLAFEIHRVASAILWAALWALDNIGEPVFTWGPSSRGIDNVADNIRAAQEFLVARGIPVPL